MSCSTCQKVEVFIPENSGLKYSLLPGIVSVEGRSGKRYRIDTPLIPRPHKPRGGWKVKIYTFGHETVVSADNAQGVFSEVKRLLELNGFIQSDINIWYNLNIQWVEKAVEKYQNVMLDSLLTIGTTNY